MARERRKLRRRTFSYYMRVYNDRSDQPIGHLVDISAGGFQLDCREPVDLNRAFQMRIDVPPEIADLSYVKFVARCKWCKQNPIDQTAYNVGFQLLEITPEGREVFNRMFEKYGSDEHPKMTDDYRWK